MKFIISGYDEKGRVFVGHWQIRGRRKRFGPGTAKPYTERKSAFLLSDKHDQPEWWRKQKEKSAA